MVKSEDSSGTARSRTRARVALVAATVADLRSLLSEEDLPVIRYLLEKVQEEVDRALLPVERGRKA